MLFWICPGYKGRYLVGEGCGPDWAVSGFLDVVLVAAFYYVKSAIVHHGFQSLIRYDLVESKWLICHIFASNIYANTWSFFDIFSRCILDTCNDIFNFKISLSDTYFATNQRFK